MLEQLSNRDLLATWQTGNEAAATILVNRYLARLAALARSRLSRRLQRRIDPEDIVLSAWRSFFLAARTGRASPDPDDDLWPLLATITLRKLTRQLKRHHADKRDIRLEAPEIRGDLIHLAAHGDPSPEHAALLADEIQAILARLTEAQREVFILTLQGQGSSQIARQLDCSDRTVRRTLAEIREAVEHIPLGEEIFSATAEDLERLLTAFQTKPSQPLAPTSIPTDSPQFDDRDILLERFVGEGAIGKVYRAIDNRTNSVIAVKFLKKSFWNHDPAFTSMHREAAFLRRISHPSIVSCQGWGQSSHGALFLVMDWIDNGNLAEWVQRDNPSLDDRIRAALEIARGIEVIHQHGILHCDLKPQNILHTSDARLVITDFGLAQEAHIPLTTQTTGGTAGFMAPEQVDSAFGTLSPATDVYGWGALVYSLLTGHPPCIGRDRSEILARAISSQRPTRPIELNPAISDSLSRLLLRCLEKSPSDRHQSMAQVLDALSTIVR